MWWVIAKSGKFKPVAERDEGYKPFVRHDYENWSYVWALFTHFLFWPRFFFGWGTFIFYALVGVVCCIGHDPKHLPAWKQAIV